MLTRTAFVNQLRVEDREWLPGRNEPTFADITLYTALAFSRAGPKGAPMDKRFDHIDAIRQCWKQADAFGRT